MVPMYEAQLPADWTYIVNDCGAKAVFCATQDIYNRVEQQVKPNCPNVTITFCFDADDHEHHSFLGAINQVEADTDKKMVVAPTADDLAGLIYTSGTTGKPKGVEIMHSNLVQNMFGGLKGMAKDPDGMIEEDERSLAFLPWAHVFGQSCELYMCMSQGASMGIARGIPLILEDMALVRPTHLFSVPTLYKRIYDGVHNTMETSTPIRKALMKQALHLAAQKRLHGDGKRGPLSYFEQFQFNILDSVVLQKIRDRFGGRMRRAFAGGAACPLEVLEFMDDIGIPVIEGYGLTETRYVSCLFFSSCDTNMNTDAYLRISLSVLSSCSTHQFLLES